MPVQTKRSCFEPDDRLTGQKLADRSRSTTARGDGPHRQVGSQDGVAAGEDPRLVGGESARIGGDAPAGSLETFPRR